MVYYSILEVTPTNESWVEEYLPVANRLVAQYRGKYLARTSVHERIEGQGTEPALRIIIEWPSRQAAINFMNDKDYAFHLAARTKGSISHHSLVAGIDELS